eukprot:Rmarinus@m.16238
MLLRLQFWRKARVSGVRTLSSRKQGIQIYQHRSTNVDCQFEDNLRSISSLQFNDKVNNICFMRLSSYSKTAVKNAETIAKDISSEETRNIFLLDSSLRLTFPLTAHFLVLADRLINSKSSVLRIISTSTQRWGLPTSPFELFPFLMLAAEYGKQIQIYLGSERGCHINEYHIHSAFEDIKLRVKLSAKPVSMGDPHLCMLRANKTLCVESFFSSVENIAVRGMKVLERAERRDLALALGRYCTYFAATVPTLVAHRVDAPHFNFLCKDLSPAFSPEELLGCEKLFSSAHSLDIGHIASKLRVFLSKKNKHVKPEMFFDGEVSERRCKWP